MKVATVALLALGAAAFPSMMDKLLSPVALEALKEKRQINAAAPQGAGFLPLTPPPFDAKSQYISNQGQYAVSHNPYSLGMRRLIQCSSSLLDRMMPVESARASMLWQISEQDLKSLMIVTDNEKQLPAS